MWLFQSRYLYRYRYCYQCWCLGFVYLTIPDTDSIEYLGSKYSSRRRKLSSTTDLGWASKTMNSKTFCVIANAFKLSIRSFSHCWSASAKVSCWAVLSPAPLVLLSCSNSACSLAWCFWMCLIKLVVLYFAVLPPPLRTFILQTLQPLN